MGSDVKQLWRRVASCIVGSAMAATAVVGAASSAGAVAAPTLTITPGPYHNDQAISVSVGANHFFTPYSRINIIECADPGGTTRNRPVSVATCDGNTIQGNTILVHPNGSFSERGYQLFALPNRSQLGEQSDTRPVCNKTNACVLYIGQNQEKFTAPKMFSAPFKISTSSGRS